MQGRITKESQTKRHVAKRSESHWIKGLDYGYFCVGAIENVVDEVTKGGGAFRSNNMGITRG